MSKLLRTQQTRTSATPKDSRDPRDPKDLRDPRDPRDASAKRTDAVELEQVQNKVMPLEEFLLNFYRILIEFVNSEDELPKVFNLYVIRTKRVKAEVEVFKRLYNNSLIYFRSSNPEVGHLVNLLKRHDKEALDFFIAGKQVLLRFFDVSHKNLSFPIARLDIRISDWMKILKSFWFFGVNRQTDKLDEFVKHVLNQNENFLTLNGVDFLAAVYNFYLKLKTADKTDEPPQRHTLTFAHGKQTDALQASADANYFAPRFDEKTLTIGKSAHKFNQKAEVVLPIKKERDDHRGLTSAG